MDTSIVLRVLLGQLGRLDKWGRWKVAYSSELLGLEVRRVIDRLRLELALDDQGVSEAQQTLLQIEPGIGSILLTQTVLYRASLPMPTALKTLDAIHLASALLFQEQRKEKLVFATHDTTQATAAKAFGFEVIGT